jgi:ribosome maturation factor RimP
MAISISASKSVNIAYVWAQSATRKQLAIGYVINVVHFFITAILKNFGLRIVDCGLKIQNNKFKKKIRNPKSDFRSRKKFANSKILPTFVPDSRRYGHLGDTKVPYFIIIHQNMIDKVKIENLVKEFLSSTELFLVAVKVSSAGKITILADKKGGIAIEECVSISRFIEKNLNRDEDDFELMVSSPGLDMPFMVKEQYYKNEGRKIEVVNAEGEKFSGLLKNVTDGGFEIEAEVKIKGKSKEKKDLSFNYDQVKSAREVVSFK